MIQYIPVPVFESILSGKIWDFQDDLHTAALYSLLKLVEYCVFVRIPRTLLNFALPRDSPPY